MRRGLALAIAAAIASQVPGPPKAWAAETRFLCENFQKNDDGTWLVLKNTFIEGPAIYLIEDNTVRPGRLVMGYDIAEIIAKACPNAVVAPPPTASPASPQVPSAQPQSAPSARPQQAPQQALPPSALPRYADANGNIDVKQLTCDQLAGASPEEADLLLAWYSGWYSGAAKLRGINLAQVRYKIRNTVDYCRANPARKLSDVMESMLK